MASVFSKIIARELPADIVFENDELLAFKDISPQAPTHILIIPKKPLTRLADARQEDDRLLGGLLLAAAELARKTGLDATGYRIVVNNGRDAGEAVPHLHVHLLGGRKMNWPPG